MYPALRTISGFVPGMKLSLWHCQYSEAGQMGSVYSYCVRGCQFGSHHGCFGFANRNVTFDVLRSVHVFTILGELLMYLGI